MSDSQDPKNFWTTLPGILTGVASLLTAFVALLNVMHVKNDQPKPFSPSPEVSEMLNLSECSEIVGTWNWFIGGETEIMSDGRLLWKAKPEDTAPTGVGQWTCHKGNPRKYQLNWQTGIPDFVTLSPDHNSLTGTNQIGVHISGARLKK